MLRAALLTGARYGELIRMTAGNFSPITAQLYVAPSKSGKARYIPLNVAGVELFRALTAGRGWQSDIRSQRRRALGRITNRGRF